MLPTRPFLCGLAFVLGCGGELRPDADETIAESQGQSTSSDGSGDDEATASGTDENGAADDAGDTTGGGPASCRPPWPLPDPTVPGDFAVGSSAYSLGSITLGSNPQIEASLRAAVRYPAVEAGEDSPAAGEGPLPIFVILHGNHPIYRQAGGQVVDCVDTLTYAPEPRHKTLAEIQAEYPGAQPVDNHLGYDYLADLLASWGWVVVSIDGNDVNCWSAQNGFVPERGQLVRAHLELLRDAVDGSAGLVAALDGRLDVDRIVVAGHSRGGEGVIVDAQGGSPQGTTVRGVVAIAPTNYLFDGEPGTFDAPILVVLPAADGDVSFNGGMRYWDLAEPGPGADATWFKAQQYVHGANHNFFNSEWNEPLATCAGTQPDGENGNGDDRLSRAEQEHYLLAVLRTFLDAATSGDESSRGALAGDVAIEGLDGMVVAASFADATDTAPLPSVPGATGFTSVTNVPFDHSPGAYNDSFFHATDGYVAVWEQTPARLSIPILDPVADAQWVSLRVAQVVDAHNDPTRSMTLELELEDADGRTVRASSDWSAGAIHPWYPRPPWPDPSNECAPTNVEKTVLQTVRIPTSCFVGDPEFSLATLTAVHVEPRDQPGALALTDLRLGRHG